MEETIFNFSCKTSGDAATNQIGYNLNLVYFFDVGNARSMMFIRVTTRRMYDVNSNGNNDACTTIARTMCSYSMVHEDDNKKLQMFRSSLSIPPHFILSPSSFIFNFT